MPFTPVTNVGEALITSLAAALAIFMAAIPRVIGFVIILIIGWIIASVVAKAVAAVLRSIKLNDLSQRAGITDFVKKMGVHNDASGFVAGIARWFIRLIFLVVAFDELGLPSVSLILQQLLTWLPNLVVAMVVLVIGGIIANVLSSMVRGATAETGLGNPELLATVARVAVWGFAIVIAVNQIGVATTLVNTLFMAFVGALALALGLAFGLGGRDIAAEIVRNAYQKSQQVAPQLKETAQVAQRVGQQE